MTAIKFLAAAALAALALGSTTFVTSTFVAPAQAQESRGASPGDFDFYLLSLSWSPAFCNDGGARKARNQCAVGRGLGFVVHGLWPQYTRGFPTECGLADRSPSRIALEGAQGVFPEEGLARYEWRKHGTCSGLSPTDYFSAVRKARDAVKIPPPFQKATQAQTWTVVDLERAFIAVNPGMRADNISVSCRKGQLSEVRVCFTKDGRGYQSCPNLGRGACRGRDFTVPPAY
jgi:ribonuclease T2